MASPLHPGHGYRIGDIESCSGLLHLTRRTCAMVLAGGRGSRLKQLTDGRARPAVPFAGRLRIIGLALSNCVNSGMRRVCVLTRYGAQSLVRHIERGWGFLDAGLRAYVDVVPARQQVGEGGYRGTADAVYQNLNLLREAEPGHVPILAGDHVYKLDCARMLADPVASGAEVTVACTDVPLRDARSFGVVTVDDEVGRQPGPDPRRARAQPPRRRLAHPQPAGERILVEDSVVLGDVVIGRGVTPITPEMLGQQVHRAG